MAHTDTDASLARTVGDLVGGPENVASVHNCTTRLRFVVRDESRVDFDALADTPGVLQAVKAGGQVQVVIGTHVDRVRDSLVRLPGWAALDESQAATGGTRRPLDAVFDFLGATFQPLIPAITGAALVQVLVLLLTQFGVLPADSPTAAVLTAAGNAVFYFLPLFVAFTASRKLGANPFVGAAVAAALLHPAFTAIGEQGSQVQAFGLPLFLYSYASSMFPALLMALALAGLDRLLKRVLPRALQQVFVPTLELLLLVPLTALVFGPIGVVVGNGIGEALAWLSTNAPFVFYVLVPALWIFLVAMGIHWALISIALVELASGSSVILGAAFGYQYSMFGVALGMLILTARQRNRKLRDTAAAATISVGIGGITEPTLYGLVLPYRRVLVIEMIGAAASGLVLGVFGVHAIGFSPAPILALPLLEPVIGAVIALIVGLAVPVVLLQVWGYQKRGATAVATDEAADAAAPAAGAGFRGLVGTGVRAGTLTVGAPIAGTVVPLADVADPIFSGGLIGPGVAIAPDSGRVVAPVAGTVVAAPASGHAIGLRADDGTELLIHVGIDTVTLQGRHFTAHAAQGERVEAGQLLLEFDAAAITAAGHSLLTPVIVTNLGSDQRVDLGAPGPAAEGDPLFTVRPAA
ncbi:MULTISPECIES: glucose PTS transporter subunit IIA [unclassified Microbacterium]|uniref:glucose PTS transporter subunit IIA n=1 Tax=unclassified Microbacterium TaxID=2609290 RepID=UPI00301778C1